jgi:hypothetical protein
LAFCVHCGELLGTEGAFCGKCGRPRARAERSLSTVIATVPPRDPRPTEEQEQEFLNDKSVRVTDTRVVVNDRTFAMGQVTSVRSTIRPPHRLTPVLMLLIGAVIALDKQYLGIGLLAFLIGATWLLLARTRYTVHLKSASGEDEALTSPNQKFVDRVVAAINAAIVYRK